MHEECDQSSSEALCATLCAHLHLILFIFCLTERDMACACCLVELAAAVGTRDPIIEIFLGWHTCAAPASVSLR